MWFPYNGSTAGKYKEIFKKIFFKPRKGQYFPQHWSYKGIKGTIVNRAWQSLNHFTLRLQSLSVVRKNLVIFQVERGFIFLKNSLRGGGCSNNLDNKILQEKGKWGGRGKGVKVEIYCNNYLLSPGHTREFVWVGHIFLCPLKNPCFEKILISFIIT